MDISDERLAKLFNVWGAGYIADPDAYVDVVKENGTLVEDYGSRCVTHLKKLDRITKT